MDEANHPDNLVDIRLHELMDAMKAARPVERGELARRYSVAITELEELMAYHRVFIMLRDYWPVE
jgi:hypothetical protein